MKCINEAVEISAQRMRNVLKRNSIRIAAALLVALASFAVLPNATLAAGPHHDQVPGFYRLKVGDLEVTALFDGPGRFDVNWLNGEKTKDGALKALQADPHLMDVSDTGYLVNTGRQLILVDAGSGTWFGGGKFGHLVANLRSAGYTPEQLTDWQRLFPRRPDENELTARAILTRSIVRVADHETDRTLTFSAEARTNLRARGTRSLRTFFRPPSRRK